MKKMVCSLLLAVWMLTLIPVAHAEASAEPAEPSFWAKETVQEAVMLGMVPERLQSNWQQDLTRGEFAQLLVNFLAVQYGYGNEIGTGFSLEDFFEDYLSLHPAPDGEPFSKADYLTEEEASPDTFYSWRGILSDRVNVFEDVEPYGEAVYINLAYLLGIVKGRDATHYDPAGTITRQEAAALLSRTYGAYGTLELRDGPSTPFADSTAIASWAEESVAVMASWDVLHGDENHAFLPYDHYTREQGVLAFMRLYKNMPTSRFNNTLAPLLTYNEVVERCLTSGPNPRVLYRAETEICTVLCLEYSGVMHAPEPAIFLVYPDSTFKRISLSTSTPQDFQLTNQDTQITFADYFGKQYTLNLQSGVLISAGTSAIETTSQTQDSTVESGGTYPEFVITLLNGSTKAVANGKDVELTAAPFIQGGSFYYPLADVAKMIGASFSQEGNTATVQISGITVEYTLGNPDVTVNGTTYRNNYHLLRFSEISGEDITNRTVAPTLVEGVFFVPYDLCPGGCPNFGLNVVREAPESGMLILGGYADEWGTTEIHLYDIFDQLPNDTKSLFQSQGVIGTVLNYSIEAYIHQGTEVYVMRCLNGQEDIENMDGKIAAIRLSNGTQDQTPRGLAVGDTAYRAWLLYGKSGSANSFYYQIKDGYVDSIVFHTRYFGSSF